MIYWSQIPQKRLFLSPGFLSESSPHQSKSWLSFTTGQHESKAFPVLPVSKESSPTPGACPLPGHSHPSSYSDLLPRIAGFQDESLPNGARVHLWHNRSFLAHLLSFQLVGQKGTWLHHLLTLVGKENLKCHMSHLHSINFC